MNRTLILIAALAAASCTNDASGPARAADAPRALNEDPGDRSSPRVMRAVAVLSPTEGNAVSGVVTFTRAEEGLRVEAELNGLPPGAHAYHVHLFGDCTAPDGKSAGTHFNFAGSSQDPPDDIGRITGNLGDLQADASGRATHTALIPRATLDGAYSILGRAVVVHEKPNDPSDPPMGAAGARLACGVIGVAER